jgi:hypothetical protein
VFSKASSIFVLSLAMLGGCAMSPEVQYRTKSGADPLTVSVADEGLSFWTDVPADDVRLPNSNVFVSGAPIRISMIGTTPVIGANDGNARIAKQVPSEFGIALAPLVGEAVQRVASSTGAPRMMLSTERNESQDVHMTSMLRMIHVGGGLFNIAPQIKVDFLDVDGKRQTRTYLYSTRLVLPVADGEKSWSAGSLRLYKQHLAVAYEALAKVILKDQRGDFREVLVSPTPSVIGEKKVGMLSIKEVLIAAFDQLQVTHDMVGNRRGTQVFIVADQRSEAELLNHR